MQETWVWSLVQEEPTCLRATKPVHHNYEAHALEPRNPNCWAHKSQLLKTMCSRACALQQEKPLQREAWVSQLETSPHSLQLEKSSQSNKDIAQSKINT